VEVAILAGAVLVRDSKAPNAILVFGPATWRRFIRDLKASDLN
jgi:hypothetical protein